MIIKEEILEVAENFLEIGGIRDDGSPCEFYGTTEQIVLFARLIDSRGYNLGYDNGVVDAKTGQEELLKSYQEELLKSYQEEVEKCFELAQRLDALNPELVGAFTGSPSERIERQLYALGVLK